MKKENRLFFLVLSMLLTCLFYPQTASARLKVFACEPEWGALAHELGGELLDISIATTGKQDPHHIQARPSLLAKARRTDLLVCTGAELEVGWLPLLIRKSGNPRIQTGQPGSFMATDYVSLRDIPSHLDRSHGDVHASGNPHIQTDPNNIKMVAAALVERLENLDPDHAGQYRDKFNKFAERWQKALEKWNNVASTMSGIPVVVHHKSWSYLVNWIGLNEVATLEPKPGVPPSSGHLAKVLNMVKEKPVKAIIFAEYEDPRSASWLAKQSGIPLVSLPFTVGGSNDATDLFSLFDSTLERLQGVVK